MGFSFGTILAVGAALFYYVRLFRKQRAQTDMRPPMRSLPINWIGMLLLIVGAALSLVTALPADIRAFWWLPVTLAFVLFSFGI